MPIDKVINWQYIPEFRENDGNEDAIRTHRCSRGCGTAAKENQQFQSKVVFYIALS